MTVEPLRGVSMSLDILFDFPSADSTPQTLQSLLLKHSNLSNQVCVNRHIFTGHLPSDIYDVACHTDDQPLQRRS